MAKSQIERNIEEGRRGEIEVYRTERGTVFLEVRRGSGRQGIELGLDQAAALCGHLAHAIRIERAKTIAKLGCHQGPM